MLERISAFWARIEITLAALLAAGVTLLILLNVVTRNIGAALFWVDELAIYAMVWMTFLGASAERQAAGSGYVIRWPSVAGRYYGIWRTTNLNTAAMSPVASQLAATTSENSYTDSPPAGVSVYYYRVSATTNHP